jgi:hypothetical protein
MKNHEIFLINNNNKFQRRLDAGWQIVFVLKQYFLRIYLSGTTRKHTVRYQTTDMQRGNGWYVRCYYWNKIMPHMQSVVN